MNFYTVSEISPEILDSFHIALSTAFDENKTLYVIFNSTGGDVDTGFAMIALVDAYVGAGLKAIAINTRLTASIAVPLFLSFEFREAFNGAKIALHRCAITIKEESLNGNQFDFYSKSLKNDDIKSSVFIENRTGGKIKSKDLLDLYDSSDAHYVVFEGIETLYEKGFITNQNPSRFPLE